MATLRRIASRLDDAFDHARMYWRAIRGHDAPVVVHVHRGFGTASRLVVSGHVIIRHEEHSRGSGIWTDLRSTLRRYVESEVMGARLTVRAGDAEVRATSDSDGHFEAEVPVALEPADRVGWHEVEVVLERWPGGPADAAQTYAAEVMVPPASAAFGVISDMDDTVLQTGISDLRRNWRQAIRSDPSVREAFPGLPELYQALSHDRHGVQRNPIFYVSSAAWGFYDLFEEFLALQEIPQGPMFLKNYGLARDQWFKGSHEGHKTAAIERLFDLYPDLPFILVGDSGQHDAMIYRRVVERHPGRVKAVWIRDVSGGTERRAEIEALVGEVNAQGVPAAFGPDLLAAAREAAAAGWIEAEAVVQVEAAVARAGGGG